MFHVCYTLATSNWTQEGLEMLRSYVTCLLSAFWLHVYHVHDEDVRMSYLTDN